MDITPPTFRTADRIVSLLQEMQGNDDFLITLLYINGRERGYAIKNLDSKKIVAFSEARSSDQTVVYCGTVDDFENHYSFCGAPTDSVFESRRMFDWGNDYQAAVFIRDYISPVGEDQ